jgi:uncharacterized membrane protein
VRALVSGLCPFILFILYILSKKNLERALVSGRCPMILSAGIRG